MNTAPLSSRELAVYEIIKKILSLPMAEVVTNLDVWQYDESVEAKGGQWGWQIRAQHEYGTGPNVDLDTESSRQAKIAELIQGLNSP